ncbi:MAG: DNA polymerase III subunit gamma/tau [Oscillospiraceae bacterium]|nr:DNA polymerase III subunit gamma/tau [Oscillospiraceae bacterium]
MKLALYRKYRPTRFSDVVGQENITSALRNQLIAGKLGHAYIFTGVRGTGKTTLAKILAKAANCPNTKDGEPCCNCDICRGIDNGSILDVTEIDAASNNRVDDVRDILEEVSYMPAICRMRVYIVDEVHMLSTAAFNALLKTLEEPPQHVLFILATTEIQKVPATILSRCQRFDLKRIPEDLIAERLMKVSEAEGIDLTEGAATLIARLADGALRDALSILDTSASLGETVDEAVVQRLTGVTDRSYLFQLSDAVQKFDTIGCMNSLQQLYENGIESGRLLNELIRHYRNLLMVRVGKVTLKDCSNEMQKKYELESGKFTEKELLNNLGILSDAADKMSRSLDREVTLELAVLKLAERGQPLSAKTRNEKAQVPVKQVAVELEPTVEAPVPHEALVESFDVNEEPVEIMEGDSNQMQISLPEEKPTDSFEGWEDIMELVKQRNRTLGSFLAKSVAHFDGTHVLIEGSDMAMAFIRDNKDSNQILKDAIFEITGKRYPIGPWKKKETVVKENSDMQNLIELARANGIDIERK